MQSEEVHGSGGHRNLVECARAICSSLQPSLRGSSTDIGRRLTGEPVPSDASMAQTACESRRRWIGSSVLSEPALHDSGLHFAGCCFRNSAGGRQFDRAV